MVLLYYTKKTRSIQDFLPDVEVAARILAKDPVRVGHGQPSGHFLICEMQVVFPVDVDIAANEIDQAVLQQLQTPFTQIPTASPVIELLLT